MKRFLLPAVLLPAVLLLAACDANPPPQPEVEREPNPLFETQIRALDQARDAGALLQDSEDARRRQLEEAAQ